MRFVVLVMLLLCRLFHLNFVVLVMLLLCEDSPPEFHCAGDVTTL